MAIRGSHQDDAFEEIHEINVTPFIDVILVLLIIFMVAAPLSTVDVNVDLPASTANPAPRPDKPLFLTVKPDLTLALGESPIARGNLAGALDAETQGDKGQRVFVRAAISTSPPAWTLRAWRWTDGFSILRSSPSPDRQTSSQG